MVMAVGLQLFLSRTFLGRAIQAVAQDQLALQLMAANPVKIKRIAFALSIATASLAGRLPDHHPARRTVDRPRIYRPHLRNLRAGRPRQLPRHDDRGHDAGHRGKPDRHLLRPSWAPAVAFGILLVTLAVRPSGILGR